MKNFLNYQSTEYDCGPVSLMNGIRFLFEREEIYPDIVKFIMMYCMDKYNADGELCKSGTSHSVMKFLADWLNHFSEIKDFPIQCEYYANEQVVLGPRSSIIKALQSGAAVVLHVRLDVWHYVLLTGIEGDNIYLFDPYYEDEESYLKDSNYIDDAIQFVFDQPKKYNRVISLKRLCQTNLDYYAMGPVNNRSAVVMRHK